MKASTVSRMMCVVMLTTLVCAGSLSVLSGLRSMQHMDGTFHSQPCSHSTLLYRNDTEVQGWHQCATLEKHQLCAPVAWPLFLTRITPFPLQFECAQAQHSDWFGIPYAVTYRVRETHTKVTLAERTRYRIGKTLPLVVGVLVCLLCNVIQGHIWSY